MRVLPPRPRRRAIWLPLVALLALAGCGVPGVVPGGHPLAPASSASPTVAPLPPIRFPQDEAPHGDLTEWWYYTGHLQGTDPAGQQHSYGFELTFFQVSRGDLAPIYIGHFAVTDLTTGQFHYDQRSQGGPLQSSASGFHLSIGDWTMQGLNGSDQLAASMPGYAVTLDLGSQKPAALHNGDGIITYGLIGFSYYYSRTHMAVTGTVTDHGTPIAVTGLAWMDHQWGNFLTSAGTGWDWFSVQLANDTEYMIYFIRGPDGRAASVVGSEIDAQGQTHQLAASQLAERATGQWRSTATGITYPSGWVLSLPGGQLTITPLVRNQELITVATTGTIYWEGACAVSGTIAGQPVSGEGYTELTGY